MSAIKDIQNITSYVFRCTSDIKVAIKHPAIGRLKKSKIHFEKLEFLGDRVLGLSIAELLYNKFTKENEGDLAIRFASLVSTDFLINLAKRIGLVKCFSMPKDFYISMHKNSSAIADMFEAVIGSIFLDSDYDNCKNIISNLWKDDLSNIIYKEKDPKTKLQEITQELTSELPKYLLLKMTGESHDPIFETEVSACGYKSIGYGRSKKISEHEAATNILKMLQENGNTK